MGVLFGISLAIFLYEAFSLILPLKISALWKAAGIALLLIASLKNMIFQRWGGGMFFAPELPYWVMLTGSLLYNLFIVAFFLLLFRDLIRVLWKIYFYFFKAGSVAFPVNLTSWAVLILAVFLTICGTWEAVRVPDVVAQDLSLPGLAPEFEGTKMALLVDLHASALNRRPFIQAIVERTNALSPDIILMPGDFVDGLVRDRQGDLEPLNQLRASLGIWGSSGNHEYYSGYDDWLRKLAEYGVTMLENQHVVLTSGDAQLVIAGVPDQQGARLGYQAPDPEAALKGAPAGVPVILMAHRPEAALINAGVGVALQLSGHTHGGHMPFLKEIIARFNGGYVQGWYSAGPMKLYVSPGTSLWNGFPMRLLDPAEITLFTLHR